MDDIYELFAKVEAHPHFIGGTVFTVEDIPPGKKLPPEWNSNNLTDHMARAGNSYIEQVVI